MSGFYASKSTGTSGGGGGGGVTTLNSLTGALTLAGADGVTITDNGTNTITIHGIAGLTLVATGVYNFAADPDAGEATVILGAENFDGLIKTADAASPGGYAGDVILSGGNSDSGHAGAITLEGGYKTNTNEQADINLQGTRVNVSNILHLPTLTQTAVDALSPSTGDMVFNGTIPALQIYYSGAWKTVTVS